MSKVRYDEIGYWSEVKLDIVSKYATEYSTIMHKQKPIRSYAYIDAFAGAGVHVSKRTGEFIAGSPMNALLVQPPFPELHFIDLDGGRAAELRKLAGNQAGVFVHEGDCNRILLEQVFPRCRYEDYKRALCLLDPYGLSVEWTVLRMAGQMRSIEIFYNFMIMDANMNVLWRDPSRVAPAQLARMDAAWGDRSWHEAAYTTAPGLFGDIEEKAGNQAIAKAFRRRLQEVAGFGYVPEPVPMRNSTGAVVYYLYFASPNKTGAKIVKHIFDKYQRKGTV